MLSVALNTKQILNRLQQVLSDALGNGYMVDRAERMASNWNTYADTAYVGIMKKSASYEGKRIGPQPWDVQLSIEIAVVCVSQLSGEDAEDKVTVATDEVIAALEANRKSTAVSGKLYGEVQNIIGYEVDYTLMHNDNTYVQVGTITLTVEVRT